MLTEERHQRILALLEETDIVKVSELIHQLQASESTIRRDLQELEAQGVLVRIHGGAKKIQHLGFEPNMKEKTQKFQVEKQKIAQYAVSLIKKDEVIYLDAGTTTLEMIPFLSSISNVKVVTNSVKHAALLIDQGIETLILGGTIKISNGAHVDAGFTTPDPEEAMIKKIAIENSQKAYVLLDHSKFQQTTFAQVAAIEDAEIITDFCPKNYAAKFRTQTTIMEVSE